MTWRFIGLIGGLGPGPVVCTPRIPFWKELLGISQNSKPPGSKPPIDHRLICARNLVECFGFVGWYTATFEVGYERIVKESTSNQPTDGCKFKSLSDALERSFQSWLVGLKLGFRDLFLFTHHKADGTCIFLRKTICTLSFFCPAYSHLTVFFWRSKTTGESRYQHFTRLGWCS